ncbi:MAG: hypothetical protein M3186_02560 [Actinomycetota bacterium]|nr:hypothetical protein [Actinomycetota bacterium]
MEMVNVGRLLYRVASDDRHLWDEMVADRRQQLRRLEIVLRADRPVAGALATGRSPR